jgi:hypothetical protein
MSADLAAGVNLVGSSTPIDGSKFSILLLVSYAVDFRHRGVLTPPAASLFFNPLPNERD